MSQSTLADRLRALFPESSGRSLKQWLESGRVEVNGRVARDGRAVVRAHDRVELGGRGRIPFPKGLGLVYQDEAIVVVDKPPRLLTMATERERERTAYRLMWDYLAAQRPRARPFIVHRLDRETSGLLVFAQAPEAHRQAKGEVMVRTRGRVGGAPRTDRVRVRIGPR